METAFKNVKQLALYITLNYPRTECISDIEIVLDEAVSSYHNLTRGTVTHGYLCDYYLETAKQITKGLRERSAGNVALVNDLYKLECAIDHLQFDVNNEKK